METSASLWLTVGVDLGALIFATDGSMPTAPIGPLPFFDVYIDESSHTNHRFLVLGAIVCQTSDLSRACATVQSARLPELPDRKMKWVKVSAAKLDAYKRSVDTFFSLRRTGTGDFHALVVDTTKQRHAVFNQGSSEIGFNKEIYQLAMKCGRLYGGLLHVYPDRRTTNQMTEDLRLMLNRGIKKNYGDQRDWPFRRVQFREPEDCVLLQLADVFAGAIAYRLNSHHLKPNASPAKTELASHILSGAGVADVTRDTARSGPFTIWHRQLR